MGEQCTFKQSCTHHNLMCNYPHCNYEDQKRRESQAQLLQDANSAADTQIAQLTAENERLLRVVELFDHFTDKHDSEDEAVLGSHGEYKRGWYSAMRNVRERLAHLKEADRG